MREIRETPDEGRVWCPGLETSSALNHSEEESGKSLHRTKLQGNGAGLKQDHLGNSEVVQWLRFCAPSTGGLGLIPGQGTRSHMLQMSFLMVQLKRFHILQLRPSAAKKMHKINFYFNKVRLVNKVINKVIVSKFKS